MFRRTKSAESTPESTVAKTDGKGRATPSRREAEAAAKARAKAPQNRREAARAQRSARASNSSKVREAMRSGDERYLPARDKGPMRRFLRDLVDARLCMAEMLLPLLILIMVAQAIGLQSFANGLWTATILLVLVDTVLLSLKIRRELKRRFPGESTKGAMFYAILRSLQLRFLRLPKPQVKLGQKLPEKY